MISFESVDKPSEKQGGVECRPCSVSGSKPTEDHHRKAPKLWEQLKPKKIVYLS